MKKPEKEVTADVKGAKPLSVALTALAAVASLWFVLVTPVRATATGTVDGVRTEFGDSYQPFLIAASVLQMLSAVCTITAAVLIATNRYAWAKRLLIAGALLGINVVPVTTGLALAAFVLVRKGSH